MAMPFVAKEDDAIPIYLISEESWPELRAQLADVAAAYAEAMGFSGERLQCVSAPRASGKIEVVLFGLGKEQDPFLAGQLGSSLPNGVYEIVEYSGCDPNNVALALALGSYRFDRYKTGPKSDSRTQFVWPDACDRQLVTSFVEGIYLTRDLVNTPAADMEPKDLARAAEELANKHGADFSAIVGEDLLEHNFPMIYTVGRAVPQSPRLIDIKWGRPDAPKVTLVGKGVCFDTGGLNLKSGAAMALMKKDMGGAANVLGLASFIMSQKLDVRLRVLIPAVENAVGSTAFRPGDVLSTRKGLTVEIGNTDAEGRLVLGDALALADEEDPDLVIDLATLTGAARVALGPDLPALYCNDDAFVSDANDAVAKTGDPFWRMPLWAPYAEGLQSKIADINHITPDSFAGSVTAALFLQRFVENAKTWVHVDLYAWNPKPKPSQPFGGEAQVIRTLFEVLRKRYA